MIIRASTHRCVQKAMGHDVTALSVVNSVGSIIARTTKLGVYLNAGRENAVASTKAFTTQVTVMALLACWFHDLRNENHSPKFEQLMASLHRLPISFGMGLRLQEQCRRWAHRLVEAEHIFILGKGYAEPIAREGALKIKECAYVHAEGTISASRHVHETRGHLTMTWVVSLLILSTFRARSRLDVIHAQVCQVGP